MDEFDTTSSEVLVALLPQEVREVPFYGDMLPVALVEGVPFVALRPITDFLGVEWSAQTRRIRRDDILNEEKRLVLMSGRDGKQYEMLALPLEFIAGWIFGISGSRIKTEESANKLRLYRRECFRVLWRELGQSSSVSSTSSAPGVLAQVRDLGLAVVQMAEEQMLLQGQVEAVTLNVDRAHTRLDRAAEVVGNLQRRLTAVERRIVPTAVISEEQAAEISMMVKSLAELMGSKEANKNHYQGIFSELYRRFGISSYKLIRQEDYHTVQAFLNDWRKTLM